MFDMQKILAIHLWNVGLTRLPYINTVILFSIGCVRMKK